MTDLTRMKGIVAAPTGWVAIFDDGTPPRPVIAWALCRYDIPDEGRFDFVGAVISGGPGSWAGVLADDCPAFSHVEFRGVVLA